jgi:DNA-binding response OmpR family regulator
MVLMLTAASTPGARVNGLTLCADDYFATPFHFPDLILRIQALARRKPHAPDPALGGRRPSRQGLGISITRPRSACSRPRSWQLRTSASGIH